MTQIDDKISIIDKKICSNIDAQTKENKGMISQNILSDLRTLTDYVSFKAIYKDEDLEVNYKNLNKAMSEIEKIDSLYFLVKMHKLASKTLAHIVQDEDGSIRLMLKYIVYLYKIKNFLHEEFKIEILHNLETLTLCQDESIKKYQEEIAKTIELTIQNPKKEYSDKYYVKKCKPFFIKNKCYYEITFVSISEKSNKLDRSTAFTNLYISTHYAVKLSFKNATINFLNVEMPILIIIDYTISIRPCEIQNFAKIFGQNINISSSSTGYQSLMKYLTSFNTDLATIVSSEENFNEFIESPIIKESEKMDTISVLKKAKDIILNNKKGCNVIKYLLFNLNNVVIKNQLSCNECANLSNLYLNNGCIPFDQMPYTANLLNHMNDYFTLIECIDTNDREHEFLAKRIKTNTEINGCLYTNISELKCFLNIEELIIKYNGKLYEGHQQRKIETYDNNLYIKSYEDDCEFIINTIMNYTAEGIADYSRSVNDWLENPCHKLDSREKQILITNIFKNAKVGLIYGAAGTGKTTMINIISSFFNDRKKTYLTNTNSALENLRQKIQCSNCSFSTITKFNQKSYHDIGMDILIIDECSAVSNSDMKKILQKAKFELLILVGDTHQIESITFGNWFNIAKSFVPKTSIFNLKETFRTKDEHLLTLRKKVRNLKKENNDLLEFMVQHKFLYSLNEFGFEQLKEDEIVLCLNYDGLYGINNINRLLQLKNPSNEITIGLKKYKIGDPVLFNENNNFASCICNNTKGKIYNIEADEKAFYFTIEFDIPNIEMNIQYDDIEILDSNNPKKSLVKFRFDKTKINNDDQDDDHEINIPFQIAYAVSIHKIQGLEYDSVKIIFSSEIAELISLNIFYTAITRAKNKLKIYCTPEAQTTIFNNFSNKNDTKDACILSNKFSLKMIK